MSNTLPPIMEADGWALDSFSIPSPLDDFHVGMSANPLKRSDTWDDHSGKPQKTCHSHEMGEVTHGRWRPGKMITPPFQQTDWMRFLWFPHVVWLAVPFLIPGLVLFCYPTRVDPQPPPSRFLDPHFSHSNARSRAWRRASAPSAPGLRARPYGHSGTMEKPPANLGSI